MQETIKVHVVKYGTRPNLVLRYVDPLTGKQVCKSSGTSRRRDAERAAGKWQAELREGRYQKASRTTWSEFRERYETEQLSTLSPRTLESWSASANHVERVMDPKFIARLDDNAISKFQMSLRGEGMRMTTLCSHLRNLRCALNWAARRGLIFKVPRVEMPKTVKGGRSMRGRPITGEEYDRLIMKTSSVRKQDAARWERLLRGLWLSGLRLGEALRLSWDADAAITIIVGEKHVCLRIYAEAQKSKRDGLLPIAPDFAAFLLETPAQERHGLVFGIEGMVRGKPMDIQRASRIVAKIGEAAGIVVDPNELRPRAVETIDEHTGKKTSTTVMVPRYATAHDLRRAFGTRWSKRVMPATLQKLMRHASIDTTMKFYVQHNADDVSADLMSWAGSDSGSISAEVAPLEASAQESTLS